MRTSRIARDTSRILAASRAQRAQRRTRSDINASASLGDASHVKQEAETGVTSQSGLKRSSAPADSYSDGETQSAPKRRKKGQDASIAVKQEVEEASISTIPSPVKNPKVKKARRTPAKKTTASDGTVKIEPPANWEEIYALTREMRNENAAPVDTMGCESLADRSQTPRDQRFQTLIALMLSSQTKDTVTAPVIWGMQERMPGVRRI